MNTSYYKEDQAEVSDLVSTEGCVFVNASFVEISLEGLDLSNVKFVTCNLARVDLRGAIMSPDTFTRCYLSLCPGITYEAAKNMPKRENVIQVIGDYDFSTTGKVNQ